MRAVKVELLIYLNEELLEMFHLENDIIIFIKCVTLGGKTPQLLTSGNGFIILCYAFHVTAQS